MTEHDTCISKRRGKQIDRNFKAILVLFEFNCKFNENKTNFFRIKPVIVDIINT